MDLWLEMTFLSFSASCLSPSTHLPHSHAPHVFHVCCLRSIETPGTQSGQNPVACKGFFQYTQACTWQTHAYIQALFRSLPSFRKGVDTQSYSVQRSKRQLLGTLFYTSIILIPFSSFSLSPLFHCTQF